MFSSSISRLLLLGSLMAVLVAASVRHPSSHSAAFVHPQVTTHGRGGVHAVPNRQPIKSRTRGESRGRGIKGAVKLHAAAKSAAKKKTKKKVSDVESFKKAEFVASVAQKTGFSRAESEEALTAVLETLTEQMVLDKKITLVGFGTFQAKARAARKGRNPRTGEELDIAASKLPSFTASKSLKNKVNGKEE